MEAIILFVLLILLFIAVQNSGFFDGPSI